MSTLILHDKKNNNWGSLGIGPLTDAMNPLATRGKHSVYELTFNYPVKGPLFKELKVGRWIVADAGPKVEAQSQRFEIASISKPIKGIVSVYCEHYRYQMLRTIVKVGSPYKDIVAQTAFNQLANLMEPKGKFSFFSDVTTKASIDFSDPAKFKNAQEVLGGVAGSILDNFGGEYVFNNDQVRLLSSAGVKTNVVIAYGKNLTDIVQDESIENTYTSVYGWAKVGNGDEEKMIQLPETYIDSEYVGNYTDRRVQMVDFGEDEPQSTEQLRNLIKSYIRRNKVGIPKVSIKASFVDLASSVIGGNIKNIETVDLCDYVTVAFNELDINTEAQIVRTVWNIALDRYESIELGEARSSFAKVIADSQPDFKEIESKVDWLSKAAEEASNIIKNPGKGHVVIYPSLADPQELLILDTTDINTAQKVWRWNIGGLGFSSTGYNGTYGLAMTNNGAIVADRMTLGTLKAISIMGVAISASDITGTNIFGGLIKGAKFVQVDPSGNSAPMGIFNAGVRFHKNESDALENRNPICGVFGSYYNTETLILHAGDTIMRLWGSRGAEIGSDLKVLGKSSFQGGDSWGALDMHGYPIYNQSDVRLKENIEPVSFDGIAETKRIQMAEFDYKQNYDSRDADQQRPTERQFGVIAQSTPFLSSIPDESKNHYLSIDINKQANLNTLTNQELIKIVEDQEERLSKIEKLIGLNEEVQHGQQNTES